jgi:hypothetical protein
MKRVFDCLSLSLLGLSLLLPFGGCQGDNESNIDTGQKGTADPKYTDTPESYQQYARDRAPKSAPGKGAGPSKAAPTKTEAPKTQ